MPRIHKFVAELGDSFFQESMRTSVAFVLGNCFIQFGADSV